MVSEQITERGIGNGISMLIFAGIIAGMPGAIGQALESARQGDLEPLILIFILPDRNWVVYFVVFIERGQRRLTVNYARRQSRQGYSAQTSHLPLKVNMAGLFLQYLRVVYYCSPLRYFHGLDRASMHQNGFKIWPF